jgi:hypothetical protein
MAMSKQAKIFLGVGVAGVALLLYQSQKKAAAAAAAPAAPPPPTVTQVLAQQAPNLLNVIQSAITPAPGTPAQQGQ